MRQVSLIALVSLLALSTSSCQIGQEEDQAAQETPSPQPAASVSPPKPSPAATPFGSGSKPLVAQQPGTSSAVPGLIQPELPESAVKRVPLGTEKRSIFSRSRATASDSIAQPECGGCQPGANNRPVPRCTSTSRTTTSQIPLAPQPKLGCHRLARESVVAATPLPNRLRAAVATHSKRDKSLLSFPFTCSFSFTCRETSRRQKCFPRR
jgi:hypothetical protein